MALFMIPYVLMFLKLDEKKTEIRKSLYISIFITGMYMLIYHILANRHIPVIDGYLLVDMQLLDSLWRPSSMILIIMFYVIMMIMIEYKKKEKIKDFSNKFFKLLLIVALIVLPANLIIPVRASNVWRNGIEMEPEYIKLSKYVGRDYDKVYAYNLIDYNFFGQVLSDYIKIEGEKHLEIDTSKEKVLVIVNKNSNWKIEGAYKIDTDLDYFDIYESSKNSNILKIN